MKYMKYNVKTKNLNLSPPIDQYLEGRMKVISRFIDKDDKSAMADVEIEKNTDHHRTGEIYRAEINLTLVGQRLLRAEATEYNIYNAINAAKEEIIRQIKSKNKKQRTLIKKGGRQIKNMIRGWLPKRRGRL